VTLAIGMPYLSDKAKADIVRKAALWWDLTGRHLVNKTINENTPAPRVRHGGKMPIMIAKAATEKDLNSGILLGRKWDDLTPAEMAQVVGAFVRHKFIPDHLN
jgi:hypothetical protein